MPSRQENDETNLLAEVADLPKVQRFWEATNSITWLLESITDTAG
jgi:hypothetical protein